MKSRLRSPHVKRQSSVTAGVKRGIRPNTRLWVLPPGAVATVLVTALVGCGGGGGGGGTNKQATPQPSASGTPSPVPSASPTGFASPLPPTPAPSSSPTPTATPAATPSPSASPTNNPTPSPSASPTIGPSPTPDPTPIPTPVPTPVPTPIPTPVPTPIPTPVPVAIVLSPDTALVSPLGTQQFTPFVGNTTDLGITYGIVEGAGGGTITGDSLYTAPLTPGTYHLTVTSHADPTKVATSVITVANRVNVFPDTKTVTLDDTVAFYAALPDVADQSVTWRVVEVGGGTISASGVYVAPRVKGTFHVIATSSAAPTHAGIATVVVQAGGATGGIQ